MCSSDNPHFKLEFPRGRSERLANQTIPGKVMMKNSSVTLRFLFSAFLVALPAIASASEWLQYESKPYGFAMLIPSGTSTKETEWTGGWGGLTAVSEGVKLFGLARLGARATDDEIEKFAVQTIGIPASAWTRIEQGTNKNGWNRYRIFQATQGSKLVFGAYGVGLKGNYLLYLETTPADFKEYRADYDKWYASIRVQ